MKKLILLPILVLIVGCATQRATFTNLAGKFLASTSITVDGAMTGWGAYVRAGQATPQDEILVKSVYQQYQADMQVATNAYMMAVKFNDPTLFTTPSNTLFSAKENITLATAKSKVK